MDKKVAHRQANARQKLTRRLYHMMSINEMNVEQLEKELKEATQCSKYVEEEIKLTGNEDLYKFAREFNSYANELRERIEELKEIER